MCSFQAQFRRLGFSKQQSQTKASQHPHDRVYDPNPATVANQSLARVLYLLFLELAGHRDVADTRSVIRDFGCSRSWKVRDPGVVPDRRGRRGVGGWQSGHVGQVGRIESLDVDRDVRRVCLVGLGERRGESRIADATNDSLAWHERIDECNKFGVGASDRALGGVGYFDGGRGLAVSVKGRLACRSP